MSHANTIPPNAELPCDAPSLLAAIRSDSLEAFQELILARNTFDFEIEFKESRDVLWILLSGPPMVSVVAFFAAEKIFNFITMSNAAFSTTDRKGRSPIMFAIAGGSIDIFKACALKKNALKCKDADGNTLAHYAAKFNNVKAIELLSGESYISSGNKSGATPFLWACSNGSIEVVNFFLRRGVDVNETTRGGWSCLHYAVSKDQHEVVKLLLQQPNILPNLRKNDGNTALMDAYDANQAECIKAFMMCRKRISPSPLTLAVGNNDFARLKQIIDDPELVDLITPDDISEAFDVLFTGTVDFDDDDDDEDDEDDRYGWFRHKSPKPTVKFEITYNPQISESLCRIAKDVETLKLASFINDALKKRANDEYLAPFFSLPNIDPNMRVTIYGGNFIITAISAMHYEGVSLLIKLGADVNVISSGKSALYVAITTSTKKITQLLLDQPDIDLKKGYGNTSNIEAAVERGWYDIADFIRTRI